jgi:hypothetical protein
MVPWEQAFAGGDRGRQAEIDPLTPSQRLQPEEYEPGAKG